MIRRVFRHYVFALPWGKYYRSAYIPHLRDQFFEYILTFFYEYPIRKGDVVLQIGASFGEETARFARAVGRKGRVIAVEPEPGNLKRLHDTFSADKYPQVTIVPKGAWKESGLRRFFVGGEREHRICDIPAKELTYEWWHVKDHLQESRYRSSTSFPVDTVDNIVKALALDRIDFVLIETNGSEPEVVQGMRKALPIIRRIGARGHVCRDGVPSFRSIVELLSNEGFNTKVTAEGMVLAERA
jgi:FkbM family methyltransferase